MLQPEKETSYFIKVFVAFCQTHNKNLLYYPLFQTNLEATAVPRVILLPTVKTEINNPA